MYKIARAPGRRAGGRPAAGPGRRAARIARRGAVEGEPATLTGDVIDAEVRARREKKYQIAIDMDFYVILGLAPGASPAEIKRAYRRLSRRYHPGINPGDRAAEAMFGRISEAYETLIDPDRRRHYDAAGGRSAAAATAATFEFTGFRFFGRGAHGPQAATFSELFAEVLHPSPRPTAGRPEPGADLHAALTVSFEESMRGVERQVRGHAAGRVRRVRAAPGGCGRRKGAARTCHGTRQGALGARTHGVHEERARRAAAPGGSGRSAARCAAATGGACAAKR